MAATESDLDPAVLAKFAKKLAGNEKKYRDRAVKKLRKWMSYRSKQNNGGFTDFDFLKIWKGLHYCMWMSDKPLIQEDLAVSLSELIHCFTDTATAIRFISAFFMTESREWFKIDRLRLDKFMRLIRKVLRQTFEYLGGREWEEDSITCLTASLAHSVFSVSSSDSPEGLTLHIADIYITELLAAGADQMEKEKVALLLEPYCLFVAKTKSFPARQRVMEEVFFPLIDMEINRQEEEKAEEEEKNDEEDEEEGEEEEKESEEEEKESEEEEKESEEEEEDEEEEESPRLNVDYGRLADRLFELAGEKDCSAKNRKAIFSLVKTFRNLSEGILPEVKELNDKPRGKKIDYTKAIQKLTNFEAHILNKTGKIPREKRKKIKQETDAGAPPKKKSKGQNGEANGLSEEGEEEEGEGTTKTTKKKKEKKVHEMNPAKKAMLEKKKNKKKKEVVDAGEENGDTEMVVVLSNQDGSSKKVVKDKDDVDLAAVRMDLLSASKPLEGTNLFAGGFFDSDDEGEQKEENEEQIPKVSKKKKKKKPAVNVTDKDDEEMNGESNTKKGKKKKKKQVQETEEEIVEEEVAEEEVVVEKKKKKKKKKSVENGEEVIEAQEKEEENGEEKVKKKRKRKSIESEAADSDMNGTGEAESAEQEVTESRKVKKKASKVKENQVSQNEEGEGEEVEIYVPNKKYKGQYKEAFEKQMKKSLKKGPSPKNDFAAFQSGLKTPPAFVRRVLSKLKTPQSEPKKKVRKSLLELNAASLSEKKRRVSFVLERNMAQDFEDSLTLSPVVPFDPEHIPDRTILKGQRSRASDFF